MSRVYILTGLHGLGWLKVLSGQTQSLEGGFCFHWPELRDKLEKRFSGEMGTKVSEDK